MFIGSSRACLNRPRVHSPRLAASSSYRRKPVSRGPRLDSPVSSTGQACRARNDGPEQKTISRSLLRGSSFAPPFIIHFPLSIIHCSQLSRKGLVQHGLLQRLQCGLIGAVLLQSIEVFQEQQPGRLLSVVELGRATRLFPEDVVNVLEGLFKHRHLSSTPSLSCSGHVSCGLTWS